MNEYFESELCERWGIPAGRLREWTTVIPPTATRKHPLRGKIEPFYQATEADLEKWHQYAQILNAGLTLKQLQELRERDQAMEKINKPGRMIEMYALLAQECQPGITPHVLRSLCVVILYQNRLGKMLLAHDLAQAAGIHPASARRHLEYLQITGALRLHMQPPRWEFSFTPQALSRYYPD